MNSSEERPDDRIGRRDFRNIRTGDLDILALARVDTGMRLDRRGLLKAGGASLLAAGLAPLLAGCGSSPTGTDGDHEDVRNLQKQIGFRATNGGMWGKLDYSPDGTMIATGAGEGASKIWDAATGAIRFPRLEESDDDRPVTDVAWSPDSRRLAVALRGGLVVWEAFTRERLMTVALETRYGPQNVTWSPDGTRLALGDNQGLRVFDAATGAIELSIPMSVNASPAAVSPDGTKIACNGGESSITIWPAVGGPALLSFPLAGPPDCLAWSPDGGRLLIGGYDFLGVYRASDGRRIKEERGFDTMGADWKKDGRRYAVAGFAHDGTTGNCENTAIRVYDSADHRLLFGIPSGIDQGGYDVRWSPDGTRLVWICGIYCLAIVSDATTGEFLSYLHDVRSPLYPVNSNCIAPVPWMESCSCNTVCTCDTVRVCRCDSVICTCVPVCVCNLVF